MKLIGVLLDVVIAVLIYYVLVLYAAKKYEFSDNMEKGKVFRSKKFLSIGVLMFLSTGIISWIRLYDADIGIHALAVVILGASAALSVCDWEIHTVPNKIIMGLLMCWIAVIGIYVIWIPQNGVALMLQSLIGGIAAGLIFLLCYVFSHHQLGAGDVKYAFVLGLYMTGSRMLGCIFYGTLICCAYSVIQLIRKKIALHDGVALIPFLYMGIIVTFFIM